MQPRLVLSFLLVSFVALTACGSDPAAKSDETANSRDHTAPQEIESDSWQYPVRLGDTRTRVHELLSNPSRTTPALEEHPTSGITVWFDGDGRVSKLNFDGEATAIYSSASFDRISSDRPLVFGLTSHTDEAGFRRILGVPLKETPERRASIRELRLVWKRDGYVVDALFLATERSHLDKTYKKGSLLWVEVYRGL